MKIFTAVHLIFLVIIAYFLGNSFAVAEDEIVNIINQDNKIKRFIESEKTHFLHKKDFDEINKFNNREPYKQENLKEVQKNNASCGIVKNFEIIGNKAISSFMLQYKFIRAFKNSKPDYCFSKFDLLKLHREIQNYYIKQGYIISRLYLDLSEISKEKIKIIIEEGRLDNLELEDNDKINNLFNFRRSTQKFFAFPDLVKNRAINLRDIEQGIDQINRLSSHNAKISLDPSEKSGYSNVKIENKINHQAIISLAVDNSGQKHTGKIKHKASLNYDNFLGANDNFYLNYSESNAIPLFGSGKGFNDIIGNNDNSNNRFSKSFYGSFSLPFGYWNAGAGYSYSRYLLTTAGLFSPFQFSGNSEAKNYYLERVLSRGSQYKTALKADFESNDTDSYIADKYLSVNSRRLSKINLYLNNIFYIKNGNFYFRPKYSKGLTAFGAMKDEVGLAPDKPRAQFENFGLFAQSNIKFNLPNTKIPINHKLTFDSLKSDSTLYGLDKFSLGGRYSIRGFQESIIAGDNGYSVKNDITLKFADLVPQNLLKSRIINFGGDNFSTAFALSKMNLGLFYDYGYVRNRIVKNLNDKGYMSGAGTVLSFGGQLVNWELVYSRGLNSPRFLSNIEKITKDNETIYFSLGVNFGIF